MFFKISWNSRWFVYKDHTFSPMHLRLMHQGIFGTEFFLSFLWTVQILISIVETSIAWGSRYSCNRLHHPFLFFEMAKAAQFHMPVLQVLGRRERQTCDTLMWCIYIYIILHIFNIYNVLFMIYYLNHNFI